MMVVMMMVMVLKMRIIALSSFVKRSMPFQVHKILIETMVRIDMLSKGAKEAVEMALREEDNFGANFNSDDIPCLGYTIFSDPHVQVNYHR